MDSSSTNLETKRPNYVTLETLKLKMRVYTKEISPPILKKSVHSSDIHKILLCKSRCSGLIETEDALLKVADRM